MSNIIVSKLDASQITRLSFDEAAQAMKIIPVGGSLVPDSYDDIVLTYIVAGPGSNQIGTVTYSNLGAEICTLTLEYDGSDRLIHVSRTDA